MKKLLLLIFISLSLIRLNKAQHFTNIWNSPGLNLMTFSITAAAIDGVNLEAGDEIGIFDGGYCVGAGVLTGPISSVFSMVASEDDPTTIGVVDGYTSGHTATFRLWDASLGAEITSVTVTGGPTTFSVGGTCTASLAGTLSLPDIAATPTSLNFGNIGIGYGCQKSVRIDNNGTGTLSVSSTTISGTDASLFSIATGGGTSTIEPGSYKNISVVFSPYAVGSYTASLDITSNDPDESVLSIPLLGSGVVPDIDASSTSLNFGSVNIGSFSDQIVTISNVGESTLDILSTSFTGVGASHFSFQGGEGPSYISAGYTRNIIVRFSPALAGDITASLSIVSNDPDENIFTISLDGTGIAPDIAASPASLSFGNVNVGSTSDLEVSISNEGNSSLEITSKSITGSGAGCFSIQDGDGSITLDPGTSQTVTVRFSPISGENTSASLSIVSNDPDENPLDISLTGTGVPPNAAPVVVIADQTIAEGSSFAVINLDNCVTDDNTTDENIVWSYSGNTNLTVSINTVIRTATVTVPNENWNGSETITFTATDNDAVPLTGSDAVVFTVTPVNDAPVVTNIPNQAIPDGGSFTAIHLDDYVTDVETPDADIEWTYSGNTNLAISIVNRVAAITPISGTWIGSETITFTATDDDATNPLSASDAVTFTITNDNLAPVLGNIPDQTIAEGSAFTTISLDSYVTDSQTPDADIDWTYSGNTELTVSITNRVATITIPNVNWNGTETITFTATDDDAITPLSGSDAAIFTVTPVNDPPVVSGQSAISTAEDQPLTITLAMLTVTDIDDTPGNLSVHIQPGTNYTVTSTSTHTPAANYNGSLSVNLVVNDLVTSSNTFVATVNVTAVNDQPVVSDIPDQNILTGENFVTIALNDYVTDVETADESILWSYAGNMELLIQITGQVATITIPSEHWIGAETIIFTASDNGSPVPLSDNDAATFTVANGNTAPMVSGIPDQTIHFGESFGAIALDYFVEDRETADKNIVWSTSSSNILSVSIANRIATITINDTEWYGSDTITFKATDDDFYPLADSMNAVFTVQPPDALGDYIEDIDINLYPNPTSGVLYIEFSDKVYTQVRVRTINTLGQVVLINSYDMIEHSVEINMNELPSGIYKLELISGNYRESFTILVN